MHKQESKTIWEIHCCWRKEEEEEEGLGEEIESKRQENWMKEERRDSNMYNI